VTPALEVLGLAKRFAAGAGSCLATAQALTGLDIVAHAGQAVAIAGPSGAGKTTFLLCAAGLLSPDSGVVRWFGDSRRTAAMERTRLHYHRGSFDDGATDRSVVHLVDVGDAEASRIRDWIESRRSSGDCVIVAVRDPMLARRLAETVVIVRDGRVVAASHAHARVAETVFR
jgi:ABC-type cobalamin/Fe3+-siderophores transport system ATPase subunit